jgi:hypothetical protein
MYEVLLRWISAAAQVAPAKLVVSQSSLLEICEGIA